VQIKTVDIQKIQKWTETETDTETENETDRGRQRQTDRKRKADGLTNRQAE
jgi:hypothetical protein